SKIDLTSQHLFVDPISQLLKPAMPSISSLPSASKLESASLPASTPSTSFRALLTLAFAMLAQAWPAALHAGSPAALEPAAPPTGQTAWEKWWDGRYASGDWLGLRGSLEDRGIQFRVNWRANYLAIVDGGLEQRGGFDQEINFDLDISAARLTRLEALEGLSFTGNVRWREATWSINPWSGTDSTFRPSAYTGGAGWRFRKAYATWSPPGLFGRKRFFTLSGGWQVPADLFLVQPDSKLFVNQSIRTAKGINPNLPWGGSFSTWGGYLRIEPADWFYAQSGLYLAYPFGTDPMNHGLSFQGYQLDPSLNGIASMNEVGFTPRIGPGNLPGKYAAGMIYWGVEQTGFDGVPRDGNCQFYWQLDQRLTREASSAAGGNPVAPGKNPVAGKLVDDGQGLAMFSTITFAPPANNAMPFYVLGGLVYTGLIPGRDSDQAGVAFAYGNYSSEAASLDRSRGRDPRTYQAVFEADYRIQLNRFAYVQPVIQYIIRPGGRGLVENDTILGLHMGVNF
ncbi:MAG: carbohydrate porin, partial [Terrimicrobiaceae bacterium]|nr:carbohydrate porin [Terrimicrobiaceae bacterium]